MTTAARRPRPVACVLLCALLVVGAWPGAMIARARQVTTPAAGTSLEAAIQSCVAITNDYRRAAGVPPLERDAELEAFALEAAAYDSRKRRPHAWFRKTKGGGISRAENQVPRWPLDRYGTVAEVVRQGLDVMWQEGPRGAHRKALANRRWTRIGCAIDVRDGTVTVVQEFR
jgi:uncharacterized protein YkwD